MTKIQKTIKVKFSEQTEKEREVALPFFSKNSAFFYMVLSENECVQVLNPNSTCLDLRVQIIHPSSALDKDAEMCTKMEFMVAFSKAQSKLTALVHDSIMEEAA